MDDRTRKLSDSEHRLKAQLLTQHHASHIAVESSVVLKHGEMFLLSTAGGDVPRDLPHAYGLFLRDNRYLDALTLTLNGKALVPLTTIDTHGYRTRHYLTNPDLECDSEKTIERNTIEVRRDRVIRSETLYEMITLASFGERAVPLKLELRFRSSFEDFFILKGFMKGPRGTLLPAVVQAPDRVRLRYEGVDALHRSTHIGFEPTPALLDDEHAVFERQLAAGQTWRIAVTIRPCVAENEPGECVRIKAREPERLKRMLERSARLWSDTTAAVSTSNQTFDRIFAQAVDDLGLLRSQVDGLHYFSAGVPWFVTLFGRDAATIGMQTLPFGWQTAGDSARLLARYQADRIDAFRDAEPGKILHELRRGELSRANEIPQSPAYYGTVDATLLFLMLIADYVDWSNDLELARELRGNIDRALHWIDHHADHDGDGYLDYVGKYENGLINQGWKDAGNSIVRADGSMPEPPIAPVEVQGYLYRAWWDTARLLRRLGEDTRASELEARAEDLKERFDRDFWSDDIGCYLVARECDGKPVASVTSNAGHVLATGIAPQHRARAVAARLFEGDMHSGWGIRTLSADNPAYNPMGYHLGSVWPHDNAFIIAGLCRYQLYDKALALFGDLVSVASNLEDFRLPELFCGHPREEGQIKPVPYPVACIPQAWAAGSLLHALSHLLGLRADAPGGRLKVVRPQLPLRIDSLQIKRLHLGAARIDLHFARGQGATTLRTEVREGSAQIDLVD
jgi:glycogen debranching enzyme